MLTLLNLQAMDEINTIRSATLEDPYSGMTHYNRAHISGRATPDSQCSGTIPNYQENEMLMLKKQVELLRVQMEEMQAQIDMQNQLQQHDAISAAVKKLEEDYQAKHLELEAQLQELVNQKQAECELAKKDMNRRIDEIAEEFERKEAALLSDLTAQERIFKSDSEHYKLQIAQLGQRIELFKEERDRSREEVANLTKVTFEKEAHINKLMRQIATLEDQNALGIKPTFGQRESEELEALHRQLTELKSIVEDKEFEINRLIRQAAEYPRNEEEKSELKSKVSTLEGQIRAKDYEIKHLNTRAEQYRSNELEKYAIESKVRGLETEIKGKNYEIERLNEQVAEYRRNEREKFEFKSQMSTLETEIRRKDYEITSLQAQLEENHQKDGETFNIQMLNYQLQDQLREKDELIENLQAQINRLTSVD